MKIARRVFRALRRNAGLKDVLVWMHLMRRPRPIGAMIAIAGAGAAVGAGLTMLLSPRSGPEVRRTLRQRADTLPAGVRHPLREARTGLSHLLRKKTDEVTRGLEHRAEEAEEKVSEALRTARETVRHKLD